MGVPTWAKVVQPAPWQRSTRYPVTADVVGRGRSSPGRPDPALAVAVRPVGADGGEVSLPTATLTLVLDFSPVLSVASRMIS